MTTGRRGGSWRTPPEASWPGVLDELVPVRAGNFFLSMVERRAAGEPVQYVLGHWAFRQLDLMVDRQGPDPEA